METPINDIWHDDMQFRVEVRSETGGEKKSVLKNPNGIWIHHIHRIKASDVRTQGSVL